MDGEISLHAWQLQLPPDVTYCLPVLVGDRLRFAPWRPGAALVTNRFGIPEPDVAESALLAAGDLAMAVMPLVGYDVHGHRLGMGGGWYDRTFADRLGRAPPPMLVGAAFASQQIVLLPAQAWDVDLDALCNEHTSLHFKGCMQ
jgi:5-formyltetrahydrofolate cyclo-ligase